MKNVKRIAALLGVVLIAFLFIMFFISAFFTTETSHAFFLASLYSLVVFPILIYVYIMIYKITRKNKNEDKPEDKL